METRIAEQDEKIAALDEKDAEQDKIIAGLEKKIAEQEEKMEEIVRKMELIQSVVTDPGSKALLEGNGAKFKAVSTMQ